MSVLAREVPVRERPHENLETMMQTATENVNLNLVPAVPAPTAEPRPAAPAPHPVSAHPASSTTAGATGSSREFDSEFDYKPLTPLAPLALFLGLASIAGFMWVGALVMPITGVIIGLIALLRIRQSEGEMSGGPMTLAGLALSSSLLLAAGGYHGYVYATEVPEGYERLSFKWLAEQPLVTADGFTDFSPEAKALNGKKVYVKGYMYPTGQLTDLKAFVLCKDTGQCCFGGQPKMTDMIAVRVTPGLKVNHRELILVGVAGTFHTRSVFREGEPCYMLEATHFR